MSTVTITAWYNFRMKTSASNIVRYPLFVRFVLLFGITIILNIFFFVLISLAFPFPQFSAFCPSQNSPQPQNASSCDAQGGLWTETGPQPVVSGAMPQLSGYCDLSATCQQPYQQAVDTQALHAFVLITVLGVLAIIVGLLPLGSSLISSGISYGGFLVLIIGSASYWGIAGNWVRLAIAAAGLAALLFIGWKRFHD